MKDRIPSWVFGPLGWSVAASFRVGPRPWPLFVVDVAFALLTVVYLLWWNNWRRVRL